MTDRSTAGNKYLFEFIGNSMKAVVPVLQYYSTGRYRLIGTGSYFIQPDIFITAAHIFEGTDINRGDGFSIVLEGTYEPILIKKIYCFVEYDLALFTLDLSGKSYLEDISPLGVMNSIPNENEVVAVFGYSHTKIDPADVSEEANGDIFQNFDIKRKWELGYMLTTLESGRGFLKGQCFETCVHAEGRDSGAPLFNSCGFFVGILSTSLSVDSGLPNSVCTSILQLADVILNEKPIKELWNYKERSAHCM